MLQQVKQTIQKYGLLQNKDRVLVALSGGADSTALLLALCQLRPSMELSVFALHVNHGIRGEEAAADAAFATDLCARYDVPCRVVEVDVPKMAREEKRTVEEAGRLARYRALEAESLRLGGAKIAVAHQREDQAETLLLRLCRGSGLAGLTAMKPKRGNIIRPLLEVSRQDILLFLKEHCQPFREDSTNQSMAYTRNRLRHQVMPLLEEIHPKAGAHLAETAALLGEENAFLEKIAKDALEGVMEQEGDTLAVDISALLSQEIVIRRRMLAQALEVMAGGALRDMTRVHYEALEALLHRQSGKRISLPQGIVAEKNYDRLLLTKKAPRPAPFCYPLTWEEPLFVPEANLWVLASKNLEKKQVFSSQCYTKWVDCDKIKGTLAIRSRQKGDFVTLPTGGHKKLKDYFSDEKIARQKRDTVPLLAEGSRIWWVIGHRFFGEATDKDAKEKGRITIWEDRHG